MLVSVLDSGNIAMNKTNKISCSNGTYFPVLRPKLIRFKVFSPCCLVYKMLIFPANFSIVESLTKNGRMNEAWLLTLNLFTVSSKLSPILPSANAQGFRLLSNTNSCKTKLYV